MELTPTITAPELVHLLVGVAGLVIALRAVMDASADRYTQSLAYPRNEIEAEIHTARLELAEAHWRFSLTFLLILLMMVLIAVLTMMRHNIDVESIVTHAISTIRILLELLTVVAIQQSHRARQRVLRRERVGARLSLDARQGDARGDH